MRRNRLVGQAPDLASAGHTKRVFGVFAAHRLQTMRVADSNGVRRNP